LEYKLTEKIGQTLNLKSKSYSHFVDKYSKWLKINTI